MLRLIFAIFLLFLALSYLGISVQTIVNSPAGQENIQYLISLSSQVWQWLMQNQSLAQMTHYLQSLDLPSRLQTLMSTTTPN
ncbi:MAG: hypothetical protein WA058_03470 [Minisyncoccia bacterium]